ncbi:putative endo-polygalacturonase [Helianthus annuus]|nr:putative endo-polygalacturonase [Helianthus annuus]
MVRYASSINISIPNSLHLQHTSFSLQGPLMVVLLSFFYILFDPKTASAATFDVTSYGAIGDGNTYDTEAFVKAWGDLCGDTSADPTLIIPSGKTFLIQCVSFVGPCKSSSVHIQLLGDITAPKTLDGWKGCDTKGYLIYFALVHGLIVDGPGQIDGQGSIWWPGGGDIKTFEVNHYFFFLFCLFYFKALYWFLIHLLVVFIYAAQWSILRLPISKIIFRKKT